MFKLRNQKGFTLMELMVVVIIVMVLAGIGVPVYMNYIKEGKKTEAYAIIDAINSGAKVYFQKNGTYAGGSLDKFLATEDVGNAQYFTYSLSNLAATGYMAKATENGTWAPAGAYIEWTQTGAVGANGDPGTGSFAETNW
jgi:prepilin-type N-terminal cleavage/methylation domain-containing protein